MAYRPQLIEPKWQRIWDESAVFQAKNQDDRPKYYVLDMFPYPSGAGLHVGHPEGYTATDIVARYKRARGFHVLHPMGYDAFGLPAEQYAIEHGVHPAITTRNNIENFRRQLKMLGFSYDWSREISTSDPSFYRWTQSIFLTLYERGLAYKKEVPVNWCPALRTVLANDEVVDGKSERGGHPVYRVPMRQWMLKITAYAERLLKDLDKLDWPEGTKELQRNWIGKSEGLRARFPLSGHASAHGDIEIFTTRPDTLFGATYMVLCPEHPLVPLITTPERRAEVDAYVTQAAQKSELARQESAGAKDKTGVFTGAYAKNPATAQDIPVWIADYVLAGYGTGAIMAVPAHDERDFEFATRFGLPIRKVVEAGQAQAQAQAQVENSCFPGEGVSVNSGFITGLPTDQARAAVIRWAEETGIGQGTIQYKLRDWLFSRQRYWGEPFPILHLLSGETVPVPLDELPVTLPEVESYEPTGTGESPLSAIRSWVETTDRRTGQPAHRETDTMPGSAGSSWYFLRYCDPGNTQAPYSQEAARYWMPVDLYIGGDEHAVGHLLYARFWTKVLHDAGLCPVDEPFQKLVHQGMILGEDGRKMSKRFGNVINPDDVVQKYGADTLRLYEMFMGPLDRDKPWSTQAVEGVYRFLQRAYRVYIEDADEDHPDRPTRCLATDEEPAPEDLKILHKTIRKVTEDIEALRFNTAVSQFMIFINHFTKVGRRPRACLRPFLQLLNPFAPHLAEELWQALGETQTLTFAPWPSHDPELARDESISVAVQVLGKTRGTVEVEPDAEQAAVEALAREIPAVRNQLAGKTVRKVIFVKDKILNFVVS